MYQFMLNENAKEDAKSLSGHHVQKGKWSKQYPNKPKELRKYLRTRKNLDGIVDYKEVTDKGKTVVYDSRTDIETDIVLYHKTEFSNMSRRKLVKLAESYEVHNSQYMTDKILANVILDAQNKYEAEVGVEKALTQMSQYRLHVLGKDMKTKEESGQQDFSDLENEDQ